MLFAALLQAVVGLAVSSSVKTSLCCCGCIVEPCPQVGPYCPVPQQECGSSMDLHCNELQQLWEESHGKDAKVTSISLKETPIAAAPGFKGAFNEGDKRFVRVLNLTSPGLQNDDVMGAIDLRETENSVDSMSDRRMTLERFQTMIGEMQQMLHKIKQVVIDQPVHREPFVVNRARPYRGSAVSEMERKVIDNIIHGLQGSFTEVRGDLKPLNEMDNKFLEYAEGPMS